MNSLKQYVFGRRGTLFGSEHSGSLALFRFLYCMFVALEIIDSIGHDDAPYHSGKAYDAVPSFEWFSDQPLPYGWFCAVRAIVIVALFSASLGILTRPALLVSFVGFTLFEGTTLGFSKPLHGDYVYHMSNLTVFALAILTVAPGVERHGLLSMLRRHEHATPIAEWPRKVILGLLSLAYFGAAYCRISTDPGWLDGYTLQGYLFERGLKHDVDSAFELAQNYAACLTFGIATVVFEATFWLVLIWPRLGFAYVVGGLLLHASIEHLMSINFFEFFILNYFAMLEWPAIVALVGKVGARFNVRIPSSREVSAAQVEVPTLQRRFVIGLLLSQAALIVGRVEKWPLSDFAVYSKRRHPSDVKVLVLGRRDRANERVHLLPERYQAMFRRHTNRTGLGRLAMRVLAADGDESRMAAVEAARIGQRAIESFRPQILEHARGVSLFVTHLRFSDATGRYEVVTDPVCDIVPPRVVDSSPAEADDG